ncbi:MAG: hypothetical protein OXI17_03970 [Gammaproteobacteria bacterium]|nr:hypothetical protein [Gammaproteobacteria bacterium]
MTNKNEELRMFQEKYLDFLEGGHDAPPTLENLGDEERRLAEAFIETIKAARGIDPYASRPSIEQLLESRSEKADTHRKFGTGLQLHLRETVDPEAVVSVDTASDATGLDSI